MILDEYNITVYTSMVNENKDLKPQAVLDIFQYGAVKQSEVYKIDGPSIIDKGIIWVLVSVNYEIMKHGTGQGEYVLKTWPRKSSSKIKHLRDYVLYDEKKEIVVKGTSVWCIVDLKTKMPCYRPEICFPGELLDYGVFENEPKRIRGLEIKNAAKPNYFSILNSYYDSNKHTNNANYGLFIYEGLDKGCKIKSLSLDFVNQTFVGDKVAVYSVKNPAEPQYFVGFVGENTIFKAIVEVE